MDTCIVCLAELPEKDLPRNGTDGLPISYNLDDLPEFLLARLPCSHVLHNSCLKPWVERANSCPICRKSFNIVELVTSPKGEVMSSYYVDDKTQNVEHNDQNMLPAAMGGNDRNPRLYTPVCFICNESGYSNLLLFCDDCHSPYHTYCLGVEAEASQGMWYCPPCVIERPALGIRNNQSSPQTRRGRTRPNHDPWERVWLTVGGRGESFDADDFTNSEEPPEPIERNLAIWNRRIAVARRQGDADILHEAVPRILERMPHVYREPELTEDEKTAWAMFEEAEGTLLNASSPEVTEQEQHDQEHTESSSAANRKRRLSKLTMSSPIADAGVIDSLSPEHSAEILDEHPESPIQPAAERKLKRPRTRRVIQPINLENPESPSAAQPRRRSIDAGASAHSPNARDAAPSPTLLDTLLADLDKPQQSSKISLKFPNPMSTARPSFLGPSSPLTPPVDTPESFPTSPAHEHPSEIIIPHSPPSEVSSPPPPPRQDSASPPGLSLSNKKEIEKLVRSALAPHYQAGDMSSDQFAEINKSVSRSLYGRLTPDGRIREWDRGKWQNLAKKEVERQVDTLKKGSSSS
ncbi:hypothetical protein ABW19_dt0207981 [Dactylella cylindrospora]|nr:hypothetical protein ABW19_dt0207981 [Dactylella cylindrospora]